MRFGRVLVAVLIVALAGVSPALATSKPSPCASADALAAVGESKPARAAYDKLLAARPNLACARAGLSKLNAKSTLDRWGTEVGRLTKLLSLAAVVGLIAAAVLGGVFVLLTYVGPIRRLLRRIPVVGRAFRPRLSVGTFVDGGATSGVGAAVAPLVRQYLYVLARQQTNDPDYTLDRLTATEDRIAAVGRLGDLAPQFKALSALLTAVPALARLPRYALGGSLQAAPAGRSGGITAILDQQHAQGAGVTLWSRDAQTDAGTYQALAAGAAAWADFEIREIARYERTHLVRTASSFAYLQMGLQLEFDQQRAAARLAYLSALASDPANAAALTNIALLDASDSRFALAVRWLQLAQRAIREKHDPALPGYLRRPEWYLASYQLAAQIAHEGITAADEEDLVHAQDHAKEVLIAAILALHDRDGISGPLRSFLTTTVEPCAAILLAGILVALAGGELLGDVVDIDEIDLVAAVEDPDRLPYLAATLADHARRAQAPSYRVFYNLACFDSQIGRVRDALDELRSALLSADPWQRQKLVAWARRDPTLELLRGEAEGPFTRMLALFELPER